MYDYKTRRTTDYYYDASERLISYVESDYWFYHGVGYGYDELSRISQMVEIIDGDERLTSYTYDAESRLASLDLGGTTVFYTYDGLGRLTEVASGSAPDLEITYKANASDKATNQIHQWKVSTNLFDKSYTYTYDSNGNITSVSDGTYTTTYVYDAANQLIRENNQAAGKTWTWTYDNAGNITSRKRYSYTIDALGTVLETANYTYGDSAWGDLLTAYNGKTITYDAIGNPLSDGTWTYAWRNGRELASMTNGSTTWSYTYDADGMRMSRSNGSATYSYVYNSGQLVQMTKGTDTLYFAYGSAGPATVTWNGTTYYYALNGQGDVIAIFDGNGDCVVTYYYDDAWGYNPHPTGSLASTLGTLNPLRYRSYVYDTETGLYYLQSRYYDPEVGRFLNADAFASTGQGLLGNNMFAYCNNNPVCFVDPSGCLPLSQFAYTCFDGGEGYAPNTEFLMAFYGVDSPREIPQMPEGAMIFVENITSISNNMGLSLIEGRTIVMDGYKYCEYAFVGVGWSKSLSMPLDRTISQGFVYGLESVNDYCGWFLGTSGNMLSTIYGGAVASPKVYAEIVGGMSYAPSVGGSITYYITGQSDWIYGRANMVVVANPYQYSLRNPTPYM